MRASGALERMAADRAALGRLATLVAQGAQQDEVFAAVAETLAGSSELDTGSVLRLEADGSATVLAMKGAVGDRVPVGTNWPLDGDSVTARVVESGRPARIDAYHGAPGPISDALPAGLVFASAGAPIFIDGRIWGVVSTTCAVPPELPADAETRIAYFADLISMTIANTELKASRARMVSAAADERRRLERDLHDGLQQRLVSIALELRMADSMAPASDSELRGQLSRIIDGVTDALDDLRELSRGIHPAILTEGGLGPALKALARSSPLSVVLDVDLGARLDERVEVFGYYVAAEAIAIASKRAQVSEVRLRVICDGGWVIVSVDDDGISGLDFGHGSRLAVLIDRVEAIGGSVAARNTPGEGGSLTVHLPVGRAGVAASR